jgi:hypothetical protein
MRPIVVTSGDASIVDGHTLLAAAQELSLDFSSTKHHIFVGVICPAKRLRISG